MKKVFGSAEEAMGVINYCPLCEAPITKGLVGVIGRKDIAKNEMADGSLGICLDGLHVLVVENHQLRPADIGKIQPVQFEALQAGLEMAERIRSGIPLSA